VRGGGLVAGSIAPRDDLERPGFVVMKRPAIGGAALGRGFEG
jgi:hypothetical protein